MRVPEPTPQSLNELIPEELRDLLSVSGRAFADQRGENFLRAVVTKVLLGHNIRDATEPLTGELITKLNLEILRLFVTATKRQSIPVDELIKMALNTLKQEKRKLTHPQKQLALWLLGLTEKGMQNVLRDESSNLDEYYKAYREQCDRIAGDYTKRYSTLSEIGNSVVDVDWLFFVYLLKATGTQTLSTRGSQKSLYGKLFERLILGSLLTILGFDYIGNDASVGLKARSFRLSSRSEKRESDAMLLYELGKGVVFDIGFIGRGNPEISLDKVTRFDSQIKVSGSPTNIKTIIIVDRVSEKSNIQKLARGINADIVQMSASLWVQEVALILREAFGFDHDLLRSDTDAMTFIKDKMSAMSLEQFIPHSKQS